MKTDQKTESGPQVRCDDGLEARHKELTDAVLDAAAKLTEAVDAAVCGGLRVTLTIADHCRIPGPSCDAVGVVIEKVQWRETYSPNWGRNNRNNQCL